MRMRSLSDVEFFDIFSLQVSLEIVETVDDFHDEVTSLDFDAFFLGNFTDTRPTILSC